MSQTTLKWLRFATPGVIILVFAALLGKLTALWSMPWPDATKGTLQSLAVLIPAGVYYLTPFRRWSNERYFRMISENLRSKLVRISGLADDPKTYTWKSVRGVFFHIIDNDKSLTNKAALAYFNGFMWTTVADIRVLGFTFTALACVLWWLDFPHAALSTILFLVIAGLTFPASAKVTDLHKDIGDEQIEIIEHYYSEEVRKKLEVVRDRAHPAGD